MACSTLALVIAGSGCGLDEAFGGDGAEPTGTFDTDTDGNTGLTAGGTSGDASGGATGPNTSTGGTGGSDTGGEMPPDDACVDVECGIAGSACELAEDGVPFCACPDGYADIGLLCAPCDEVAGDYQVTLATVNVRGTVRINGAVPPKSHYEDGNLLLRNRGTADVVPLGSTRDDVFEVNAVPGRYDVVYALEDGGSQVPINSGARLMTLDFQPGAPALEIDIPVVFLTGTFTLDNAPPPESQYEDAQIVLVDPVNGDEVLLGHTRNQSYGVNVIPGSYEIHYRRVQGGDQVPLNGDALLDTVTIDNQQEVSPTLDINIVSVLASGPITVNDAPPPTSEYDDGDLVLRDPRTSDEIPLASTKDGAYQARVIAGAYEVFYRAEDPLGGGVPVNENAFLEQVDLDGAAVPIDIPMVTVGGDFTLDTLPPPASVYDSGEVSLVDPYYGDRASLGYTHTGSFAVPVVAGMYDVEYGVKNTTGLMPANTHARIATAVSYETSSNAGIDIPTTNVSGTVTLNGQVPPGTEYQDGRLYLRGADTGDRVLLGNTHDGAFSRLVVPGVYAVHYGLENGGEDVPINGDEPVLFDVDVGASNQVDVSIAAAVLSGSTVVDAAPAPGTAGDAGEIVLRSLATDDTFVLTSTHASSFGELITSGRYVVEYRATNPGALMPRNQQAGLACIRLP